MVADQADIHHAREGPDVVRAGEGDSVANVVVSEQVRLVYGQAGVGSVVAALLAAMTVYATRGLVPVLVVAAWCVAFAALSLGRWWLLRAYAREGERRGDVFQWRRRWILSMFFAGVI